MAVAGLVWIAVGLVFIGRIVLFYVRTSVVGGRAVHAAETARSARSWPDGVLAVVRIPSIGVVAPVEQGTSMGVLNVAVGHLRTSVDPGEAGTSILAAHNVSWFSGLGGLRRGSIIEIDTPTGQQVYRVAWHRVVHVGAPVANSSTPTVVLEACWPLNALYLTPERYLVGANLVSVTRVAPAPSLLPEARFHPVGIPQPIAGENLNLADNNLPMGSFAVTGRPSPAWEGSSAPYSLATAEVNWLIALLHASAARSMNQLEAVSRERAAVVAPLANGYTSFSSLANLTEQVVRTTAIGGTASVAIATPSGPVEVTEHFAVHGSAVRLVGTTIVPER
jgi:sortase A